MLPKIMHNTRIKILFETPVKGIKQDDKISPQNIINLWYELSAIYPITGCKRDENMCETVRTIVATAIEIPIFAAINGIIGFTIPV